MRNSELTDLEFPGAFPLGGPLETIVGFVPFSESNDYLHVWNDWQTKRCG
jgi:hypothetical protein